MTSMLRGPDWTSSFHICANASGSVMGVVLGQKENQQIYGIHCVNKIMTHFEINYNVMKEEFPAFIYAINKFRLYITRYKVFVHTYHCAYLVFLWQDFP
jgi:hypothetical protein